MKLTIQLQLLPTPTQAALLRDTMRRVNEAATFAAEQGFAAGVFSQPSVHRLSYRAIREQFGLSAQLAVRAIGKAVECFARDKTVCPVFRPDGAVTYDQRNLAIKGLDRVSLATLTGRELIPIVYGEYQRERFDRIKGQSDLVYRDGKFFLLATVDLPEPPPGKVKAFLGVDMGIVNIAVDSTGAKHTGAAVEKVRKRFSKTRRNLQRKGTKSAKRILRNIRRREARFRRHENHVLSKKLVATAKALGLGIAVEDLNGIRERVTVGRRQRAKHSGWAFFQLRAMIEYKARLAGVPFVVVDPRNSSRECSACGHCEAANRKSQSEFACLHCGFVLNADHNAAIVIAARGNVIYLRKRQPVRTQLAAG